MNSSSELARLFRFVETMPTPNIIAMLFRAQNLLLIDKEHWERIDNDTREMVYKTQEPCLEIYYPKNKPPFVTPRSKDDD